MLASADVSGLSRQQKDTLRSMGPEQRAKVAKLIALAPLVKKIVIAVVILFIAMTLLPFAIAFVTNP